MCDEMKDERLEDETVRRDTRVRIQKKIFSGLRGDEKKKDFCVG